MTVSVNVNSILNQNKWVQWCQLDESENVCNEFFFKLLILLIFNTNTDKGNEKY